MHTYRPLTMQAMTSLKERVAGTYVGMLWALILFAGCEASSERPASFTARDSSGVTIVANSGRVWTDETAWRVIPTPILEIGTAGGDEMHVLSQVVGAAKLSDGTIVIGDGASRTIRFFSPEGTFISRSGQVGEGPGEYSEITRVAVGPSDTVIVMDQSLQRITMLDATGSFVRSIQLPSTELNGRAVFVGILGDRHVVLDVGEGGLAPETGLQRQPRQLFTFSLSDRTVTWVASILGVQQIIEPTRSVAYLFGADTEVAVSEAGILTLSTERPSVTLLGASGTPRLRFSWEVAAVPVTQALVSAAMEERIALFPPGVGSTTIERLRSRRLDATVATHLPAARSLYADSMGNTWVEPYPIPGKGANAYLVFDPNGVLLGEIALPPQRKRGTVPLFDPTLEIGADYILGVWVDDLGVEFVREYRLEKSAG